MTLTGSGRLRREAGLALAVAIAATSVVAQPVPLAVAVRARTPSGDGPMFHAGLGAAADLTRAVLSHHAERRLSAVLDRPPGRSPGQQVAIHTDDGLSLTPFSLEGRLTVADCIAGPTDFLAFRFSTNDLARELPVHIAGLELSFDNRFGRTVWPLIGIALEDTGQPLRPSATLADAVTAFSSPLAALAPPSRTVADAVVALAVGLPLGADPTRDLSVDDGMWSDDFDRTVDEPLDNPASDWLECSLSGCSPAHLLVQSQQVRKSSAGDALGLKLAAAAIDAIRPVRDLDLALSVDYDVTSPQAERAGIVFRLQTLDQYYLAEYRSIGANDQLVLSAATPGGMVQLGAFPVSPAQPQGRLEVKVWGSHPTTHIEVGFAGAPASIVHHDAVYTYTGVFLGLAGLGSSQGEQWNDFVVERNRDLFAVVQIPPGEVAGLPAEVSPLTLPAANVLRTSDGVSFTPLPIEVGCQRAASGFVSILTVDTTNDGTDNVFLREARLTRLDVTCPTCAIRQSECSGNQGSLDATSPQLEAGQPIDLNVQWWNHHAPDVADLMLRFIAFDVPCGLVGTLNPAPIGLADVVPIVSGGQTSGGPQLLTLASVGLTFTPIVAGEHCLLVLEHYDTNGDGCADGWEGTPCPPGCTCVGDPDDNASTGIIATTVRVEIPCNEGTSQLQPNSLRAAPDADPSLTALSWQTGGSLTSYNLHSTEDKAVLQEPRVRDEVPLWRTVGGSVSLTDRLGDDCRGIHYVVAFERDACLAGRSLPDP